VEGGARCGRFQVWEDRQAKSGRRIELRVGVLPAQSAEKAPDAVTFFGGGPSQAVSEMAAGLAAFLAPLRQRRDILLVDQRGTGGSASIDCDLYGDPAVLQPWLGDFYPAPAARVCRERFGAERDLTRYTTADYVDDVEEVRAALGYQRLGLIGASYGTRVALVYLRRHPRSVRAVVLHGVAAPGFFMPLDLPRASQQALDGVLSECAADPACRTAFPDTAAELNGILERAAREPVTAEVLNPASGLPERVRLSRDVLAEAVRYMLYESGSARQVPAFVRAAAQGDYAPLAEQAQALSRSVHAVVPHAAHDYRGLPGAEACVDGLILKLLETGAVEGLDLSCLSAIGTLPFASAAPKVRPIVLEPAALARFAGRFRSEQPPLELQVSLQSGALQAELAGRSFRPAPVSPTRFRIVGGPPTVQLEFEGAEERATGAVLDEGAGPTLRFVAAGTGTERP
jgi:pimeloyl-ACP methyl ester carboxylesterase